MASIINLNRARKAKNRAEAERQAETNRAAFGRPKAERQREQQERDRVGRDLDSKKID